MKKGTEKKKNPAQHQKRKPGLEQAMRPEPQYIKPGYQASGKLKGKAAIITGADSGIGRAIALAFAMEGADVVVQYLDEHKDAKKTQRLVEKQGRKCILVPGDIKSRQFCEAVVEQALAELGRIDILVNNAAQQFPHEDFMDIEAETLEDTFRVNIFAMFYLIKAALPHMRKGSSIINTASVTAYRGSAHLVDYSSTKGAIVAFTRSLSKQLINKGIYVNAVAPGPIWTPLIVSTFSAEEVASFGVDSPMGRAGQPSEVAPCYVFLASDDASYMSGQVLHPNGGEIVNA